MNYLEKMSHEIIDISVHNYNLSAEKSGHKKYLPPDFRTIIDILLLMLSGLQILLGH